MFGIYAIKHKHHREIYIGRSSDIERRWRSHIRKLINNTHKNNMLQARWNEDPTSLEFLILKEVSPPPFMYRYRFKILAHWEMFYYRKYRLLLYITYNEIKPSRVN